MRCDTADGYLLWREMFFGIFMVINLSPSPLSPPEHGLCPQVKCPEGSQCLSDVKASETLAELWALLPQSRHFQECSEAPERTLGPALPSSISLCPADLSSGQQQREHPSALHAPATACNPKYSASKRGDRLAGAMFPPAVPLCAGWAAGSRRRHQRNRFAPSRVALTESFWGSSSPLASHS